jgi:transporter family-2 protein
MNRTPASTLLALSAACGAFGAAQGAINGAMNQAMGSALAASAINNLVGLSILLAVVALRAPLRAALGRARRSGLPLWTYLGGLAGALFVLSTAVAVPVVGVSAFAIAQVFGIAAGAVVVDRTPIGPAGVLPVSGRRVGGAALGLVAVAVSQIGHPAGHLAVGVLTLVVVAGALTTVQVALNARVIGVSGSAGAATVINFSVGLPALLIALALAGGAPHGPPHAWWLYLGGVFGVIIVGGMALAVRGIGVLRSSLALTAGQLGCALLIDALLPGGTGLSVWLAVGAVLTRAAVAVTGAARPAAVRSADPSAPAGVGATVRPRRLRRPGSGGRTRTPG